MELVLQLPLCSSGIWYALTLSFTLGGCKKFLDFKSVGEMTFSFELGKPFRPFGQLMGVMPEASKELLPGAYQVR